MRFETSIPSDYFDAMYADDPDPWRFASSAYERDKYAATLAALRPSGYDIALEVGCSIGVFTQRLARRCQSLLAVDVALSALDQAKARCADLPNVRFAQYRVPEQWPAGIYDLILLSEVVYYFDPRDVDVLASRVAGALRPGGDVVLVHWLGKTHYPLTGDDAAERFMAASAGFARVEHQRRSSEYRLDVLSAVNRPASAEA